MVLWEILEASTPYNQFKDDEEVIHQVCDLNYTLSRPTRIAFPDALWDIMKSCWKKNPDNRQSFIDICTALEQIPLQKEPDKLDYLSSAQYQQEKDHYKLTPSSPVSQYSHTPASPVVTPTVSETSQASTSGDNDFRAPAVPQQPALYSDPEQDGN